MTSCCLSSIMESMSETRTLTNSQLGLHFSDADDIAKHFTSEQASMCFEQWYGAVRAVSLCRPFALSAISGCRIRLQTCITLGFADQQSMWGSDILGEPTLEHVQTYILLSVLMVSEVRSHLPYALNSEASHRKSR